VIIFPKVFRNEIYRITIYTEQRITCDNHKKGRANWLCLPSFLLDLGSKDYFLNFLELAANPMRPKPRRSIVVGSGTDARVVPYWR